MPCRGADSIWYCHLARRRNGIARRRLANPATRHEAQLELAALLAERAGRGRRVLIGFDFANGYPAGLVAAAGWQRRGEVPWRGLWRGLAKEICDGPDNANNRFEVAAALNKRISGRAFPFWGCPAGRAGKYLTMRKPPFAAAAGFGERRLCELRVPRAKTCWQLAYNGAVGSQTLMGVPVQTALRWDSGLAHVAQIWPYETGLAAPTQADAPSIVIAEVYPSLFMPKVPPGGIKDAVQVESTARILARRDSAGLLACDLAGPADLSAKERRVVEREEGWILGAGTYCGEQR